MFAVAYFQININATCLTQVINTKWGVVPRAEASGDESGNYINTRGEGGVVGSLQRVEREILKNRFFHFPVMAEGEGGGGSGSNNANVDTIKFERVV